MTDNDNKKEEKKKEQEARERSEEDSGKESPEEKVEEEDDLISEDEEEEEFDEEEPDIRKIRKLKRGQGRRVKLSDEGEWLPRTQLGKMVKSGKIRSMKEALSSGLPLREPQIVDTLLGDTIEDEVLKVNMVQRMTDSGRRTRFSITVVVGNGDGYVGLGSAKGKEVGPTIKKAIDNAKLNMIELTRGCGSWECGCMNPHSLPYRVEGKSGSAKVVIRPAPRGVGLAVGDVAKKILKLAGINDAWGFSRGQTKTTINNAKAVMDALSRVTGMKVQESQRIDLKHVSGPTSAVIAPEVEAGGEDE
jgi:small subunit ribosomal protein S5